MQPKVSIIVPCFNQADYLAEALDSIISQTYSNWECIVVNDGSLDESEKIALRYCGLDNRINYLFQQNKGVSAARNYGINSASGELILPLDGDDYIAPIYLEKAVEAFIHNPGLKIVYGEAEFVGERTGKFYLDDYSYLRLLISNIIYCSAIYKRDDFLRINGYSDKLVHGFEDWDFWIRLLDENSQVLKLPELVFFYRIKKVSRSTELLVMDRQAETEKMILKKNIDIYNKYLFDIINNFKEHYYKHIELNQLKESRTFKVFRLINNFKNFITGSKVRV